MRTKLFVMAGFVLVALVAPAQASTMYTYDALGRLSIATYDNGMQIVYSYDTAGNRTQVVTQTGSNIPPQANNDWITIFGSAPYPFDPTLNDSDPKGYPLTVTAAGTPSQGSSSFTGSSVTYTPSSYVGLDPFTYTISNGHGGSAQATVFVNHQPANPPIANDYRKITPQNTAVELDPLSVGSDPLNFPLTIDSVQNPSHGTMVNHQTSVTYTPTTGFIGADTFGYTISDGHRQTASANIIVGVGTAPTAVDDWATVAVGSSVTYDPRLNDSDSYGYPLTVTSTTTPEFGGTVTINANSTLTYQAPVGFTGVDDFQYTITDSHGLWATATDRICVGYLGPIAADYPANTIPIYHTPQNPYTRPINVLSNDTYCGTATLTVGSPSKGFVTQNPDGTLIYTYGTLLNGTNSPLVDTDSFTYTLTDSVGDHATGKVIIGINATYEPN